MGRERCKVARGERVGEQGGEGRGGDQGGTEPEQNKELTVIPSQTPPLDKASFLFC